MEEIRLLGKEDIEVRVAQTTASGDRVKTSLLLYKNARIDMKILDELYTPLGWKRSHKLIGDRLYCQVDVWDAEKKEWISKEDVGVESNTEAEKGQASDSFKRACVNWGIGRELYTAPRIAVELNEREYTRDQSGKIRVWASFAVGSIDYDKKTRTITSLEIVDRLGNVRFSMSPVKSEPERTTKRKPKKDEAIQDETPVAYTPFDENTYWKVVEKEAKGIPSLSGQSYREMFIEKTHPGKEQLIKFDNDVDNVRAVL